MNIEPTWIDYNGHLNMAYYHVLFDRSVDHFFDLVGIGEAYLQSSNASCFVLEVHVNYLQELSLEDPVVCDLRVLDFDEKRIHYFQEMRHADDGFIAATSEQLTMHVDMNTRRSAPFAAEAQTTLAEMLEQHAEQPMPAQVGRRMGIRRAS